MQSYPAKSVSRLVGLLAIIFTLQYSSASHAEEVYQCGSTYYVYLPEETYLRQYNNNGDLIRDFSGKNSADVFYTGDSIYILRDDYKMFHYGEPGWIPHSTDNPDGSVGIDVVKTCQAGETIYFLQKDKNVLHFGHNGRERGLGNNDIANIYQTGDSVYVLTDARKLTHYGKNGWIHHSTDVNGWVSESVRKVVNVADSVYFLEDGGRLRQFDHGGLIRNAQQNVADVFQAGDTLYSFSNDYGGTLTHFRADGSTNGFEHLFGTINKIYPSGDLVYVYSNQMGGMLEKYDAFGRIGNGPIATSIDKVFHSGSTVYAYSKDDGGRFALYRADGSSNGFDHIAGTIIDVYQSGDSVYVHSDQNGGMIEEYNDFGRIGTGPFVTGIDKVFQSGSTLYAYSKDDGGRFALYRADGSSNGFDHIAGTIIDVYQSGDLVYLHSKEQNGMLEKYDELGRIGTGPIATGIKKVFQSFDTVYAYSKDYGGRFTHYRADGSSNGFDHIAGTIIDVYQSGDLVYLHSKEQNGMLEKYDELGRVGTGPIATGIKKVFQSFDTVYAYSKDYGGRFTHYRADGSSNGFDHIAGTIIDVYQSGDLVYLHSKEQNGMLEKYDELGRVGEGPIATSVKKVCSSGDTLYVHSRDYRGMLKQFKADGSNNSFEHIFGKVKDIFQIGDQVYVHRRDQGGMIEKYDDFGRIGDGPFVTGIDKAVQSGGTLYAYSKHDGGRFAQYRADGSSNGFDHIAGTIKGVYEIGELVYVHSKLNDGMVERYDEVGRIDDGPFLTSIDKVLQSGGTLYAYSSIEGGRFAQYRADGTSNGFGHVAGTISGVYQIGDFVFLHTNQNGGMVEKYDEVGRVGDGPFLTGIAKVCQSGKSLYAYSTTDGGRFAQYRADGTSNGFEHIAGTIEDVFQAGDVVYVQSDLYDGMIERYDENGRIGNGPIATGVKSASLVGATLSIDTGENPENSTIPPMEMIGTLVAEKIEAKIKDWAENHNFSLGYFDGFEFQELTYNQQTGDITVRFKIKVSYNVSTPQNLIGIVQEQGENLYNEAVKAWNESRSPGGDLWTKTYNKIKGLFLNGGSFHVITASPEFKFVINLSEGPDSANLKVTQRFDNPVTKYLDNLGIAFPNEVSVTIDQQLIQDIAAVLDGDLGPIWRGIINELSDDEYDEFLSRLKEQRPGCYVSHKEFVDWASAETVALYTGAIVATSGAATEVVIQDMRTQLENEFYREDGVLEWLEQRGIENAETYLEEFVDSLSKGLKVDGDMVMSGYFAVKWHNVKYTYGHEPFTVNSSHKAFQIIWEP